MHPLAVSLNTGIFLDQPNQFYRERGCVGNIGGSGILLNSAGTVDLTTLGISDVKSFLCTSDVNVINLCFPSATQDCFQATTVTDGCANVRLFSRAFASVSLTTAGTQCTLYQCVYISVVNEIRSDVDTETATALVTRASLPSLRLHSTWTLWA
jgi:hypothetical protein